MVAEVANEVAKLKMRIQTRNVDFSRSLDESQKFGLHEANISNSMRSYDRGTDVPGGDTFREKDLFSEKPVRLQIQNRQFNCVSK